MPHQGVIPTVVVSRPGVMQQALRTSLMLCSAIAVVSSAGDGLTALNQIVLLKPALVVIDSNLLQAEIEALLAAIKAGQAPPHCLVVAQSSRQAANLLAAGADAVIVRDSSAQDLAAVLMKLAQLP